MNFCLLLTIITLDSVLGSVSKLFYEKDLSEYCKRRVIPSIFIGRNVVEASSSILHFTKLDLPYGCFISVRAESGCNMIMVINLPVKTSLKKSCSGNSPQLLVYEMGETFGGYWGAIPLSLLQRKAHETKYYTLKTTQRTTEAEPSTETEEETSTLPSTVDGDGSKDDGDFMQVEVPIVQVSGQMVSGEQQPMKGFDFDEAFDYQYDVTPVPGEKYDTSILPLVQLSVRNQPGHRRHGEEPRYDLDIVEQYTPDARLTLPQMKTTPFKKPNSNRRLSFAKKKAQTKTTKKRLHKTPASSRKTTTKNKSFKYIFPTTIPSYIKHRLNHTRESWESIDRLMEKNNKHNVYEKGDMDEKIKLSRTAENISNMKHNLSIYLAPNLSIYNDVKPSDLLSFSTTQTFEPSTRRSPASYARKLSTNVLVTSKKTKTTKFSSIQTSVTTTKLQPTTVTSAPSNDNNRENTVREGVQSTAITTSTTPNELKAIRHSDSTITMPPVSLVDHESWENLVQAAPGMAELLNKSIPYDAVNKDWSLLNETYRKELLSRKKRGIHAIAIESDRPHSMTTRGKIFSTTKEAFLVKDMQKFARLVELKDDDMPGRVPLRFLKQYVGPTLYNICAETHTGFSQQVYLINTSRIVLSLNNFTLDSLSVILTAARTLMNGESLCPESLLECQISGARVCVDSLTACDGIPNCGSYDIYDEDRLMCGAVVGLQHNVYLAAFTFLALLLTMLYAVHYWLKRCVPHVADAFFVYTDGVENILYLETVMRAPGDGGDTDDSTKMYYNEGMFDGGNAEFMHREPKRGLCSRLWRKCYICFHKEKMQKYNEPEQEISNICIRKTYSFTQMELSRISKPTVDTSVQTGDSLEMAVFEGNEEVRVTRQPSHENETDVKTKRRPPILFNDSLITLDEPLPEDELSLLKFFRDSRSSSEFILSKEINDADDMTGGEMELSTLVYDRTLNPGPSGLNKKTKVKPKVTTQRKRLRFDDNATTIPSHDISDEEEDDVTEEIGAGSKRQVLSLGQSWRSQHLSTIKEDDETGRHRHFWEGKGKKTKKKTNTLRYSS